MTRIQILSTHVKTTAKAGMTVSVIPAQWNMDAGKSVCHAGCQASNVFWEISSQRNKAVSDTRRHVTSFTGLCNALTNRCVHTSNSHSEIKKGSKEEKRRREERKGKERKRKEGREGGQTRHPEEEVGCSWEKVRSSMANAIPRTGALYTNVYTCSVTCQP